MASLIGASSAHFMVSHQSSSYLSPPRPFPIVLVISSPKRQQLLRPKRKQVKQKKQNKVLFEFSDYFGCGFVWICKKWEWEWEGDPMLELEVLEVMKNSKNPEMFPTKRELFEVGRVDLVEAILKRGGWMSMGWEEDEEIEHGLTRNWEFAIENCSQNGCEWEGRSGSELNEGKHLKDTSFLDNSSTAVSSSGRSLEMAAEDDSGSEGILNRFERQRSLSFGLNLGKNGSINHVSRNYSEHSARTTKDVDSRHPERSECASLANNGHLCCTNGSNRSYANLFNSSLKVDTWRTWSIQRTGFSDTEYAVAPEIAVTTVVNRPLENTKDLNSCSQEITHGDMKAHLQHLELELSSALCSLRSNTAGKSEKVKEHFSEDLRQLSDAWEFQENDLMNAQRKLRSMRARLAVLQGKMALAIIDAQKILDEKQKRSDDARRTLQLLRSTCLVWPNSGSEVLLAGSYDGWATQRKMERSSTGIFSVCLMLYPGKYEIKFIVDGSWKVDPLRPIVNNGFENNLLIIKEI